MDPGPGSTHQEPHHARAGDQGNGDRKSEEQEARPHGARPTLELLDRARTLSVPERSVGGKGGG
jgi:hypothetical protein